MNKFPRYMRKENWPAPEEETFGQSVIAFVGLAVFLIACVALVSFFI